MLFDIAPVKEALHRGDTLLTPTGRLASAVSEAWGQVCRQAGQGAWRAPAVYAFNDWLAGRWRELVLGGDREACARRLLSAAEEQRVWEEIIRRSRHHALLRPGEVAQQAAAAKRTMVHWRCGAREEGRFRGIEDCEAFLEWSAAFRRRCTEQGWLSSADRDVMLLDAFRSKTLPAVPHLVLLDFTAAELTPLQEELLTQAATQMTRVQAASRKGQACRLACADADAQLYAAARWARALLLREPTATAGVVVPQLVECRQRVERIFLEVFDPGALLPGTGARQQYFNISAGLFLAQAPLPAALLRLFALCAEGLPPAELRELLRTPFLNVCDDPSRTRLCGWLAEWPLAPVSARSLVQRLEKAGDAAAAVRLKDAVDALPRKAATARQWCGLWRGQMVKWGCNGSGLGSIEYRQWERWHALLDEFAIGSEVFGPMKAADAVAQLKNLAGSTMSQPLGEGARLHILGTLEAKGLSFSGLWLSSMGDEDWPQPAEPSRLLPIALQREQEMPRADAARELAYARALTENFLHAADQVVCSYPQREGERILGRPSTLIAHLPETDLAALDAAGGTEDLTAWRRQIQCSVSPETVPAGGKLPPPEGDALRGGTGLLRDQSACPFRACARYRWHLRGGQRPASGLSAAEQGTMVHRAMQHLWNELGGDSCALTQLQRCRQAVAEAAAAAVKDMEDELRRRHDSIAPGPRLWQVERRRVEALLHRWLEEERALAQDGEFKVVAAEESEEFEFEGLTLNLRPDRADQLPGGSCRVVDYKTGKRENLRTRVRGGDWSGDFPREPQLPLYALAWNARTKVRGIAYAAINGEDMGYVRGAAKKIPAGEFPPPEEESWPRQLKRWQESLGRLAREYGGGLSEVRPRVRGACEYCELGPLCRIRPQDRR